MTNGSDTGIPGQRPIAVGGDGIHGDGAKRGAKHGQPHMSSAPDIDGGAETHGRGRQHA